LPNAQLPQTVLPFAAPQVPSVVTAPVAAAPGSIVVDLDPMTGSAVVADGEVVDCAAGVPVHPFWHPLEARQCPGVEPQYLESLL